MPIYGDSTTVAQITLDNQRHITHAENVPIAFPATDHVVKVATLRLEDADILHILSTPKTLVTPPVGYAVFPLAAWAILNATNGTYQDPDGLKDIQIFEQNAQTLWAQVVIDTSGGNDPGALLFPAAGLLGQASVDNLAFRMATAASGAEDLLSSGPLIVQKNLRSLGEFTGGGLGNYLTILVYYAFVPTT